MADKAKREMDERMWVVIMRLSQRKGPPHRIIQVEVEARHDEHARMNAVLLIKEVYPDCYSYRILAVSGVTEKGVLDDNCVLGYAPDEVVGQGDALHKKVSANPDQKVPPKDNVVHIDKRKMRKQQRKEKEEKKNLPVVVAKDTSKPAYTPSYVARPALTSPFTEAIMKAVALEGVVFGYNSNMRMIPPTEKEVASND